MTRALARDARDGLEGVSRDLALRRLTDDLAVAAAGSAKAHPGLAVTGGLALMALGALAVARRVWRT